MTERRGRWGARAVAGLAEAGRRPAALPLAWPDLAALRLRLRAALVEEAERGRPALWLPVAAMAGVVLFFAAERDPSVWAALAAAGLALALAWAARLRPAALALAAALAAVALGFAATALRVERVDAPILARTLTAEAVGTVERVEPRGRGARIVLRTERLGDLPAAETPPRVRVVLRRAEGLSAGMRVAIRGLWRPPPAQARPGGYDFARDAFFAGLGAVGVAYGSAKPLDAAAPGMAVRAGAAVDRLRNAITARIRAVVPGDSGAVAAALVTGQRGDISESLNDAMRAAGIYHVLSISGTHMALVAGTIFFAVRLVLVLVPGLALRRPIKKWAAGAALLGATLYLVLSGGGVATERSYLMAAVVLIAVLCDREGLTVRSLALAAAAAIALTPEAVLGPSFQMSFAAVLAIVAGYERWSERAKREPPRGPAARLRRTAAIYFGGIALTTLLASVATAPYGLYHFQQISTYALAGNLVVLPIVGVIVMPAALGGLLAMPFGLDAPFWIAMGFGIDLMAAFAREVAGWPGAVRYLPAFGPGALMLLSLALIWAALFTTRLRWLAVVPLALGIMFAAHGERPDVLVEPGGRAAAVRAADGRLRVIGLRFGRFAARTWLAADGDGRTLKDPGLTDGVRCDEAGCTAVLPGGRYLSLTWSYRALLEDCERAAIVVTRLAAPPDCRRHAHVIDAADLASGGAVAMRLTPGGIETTHARPARSDRRWYPRVSPPAAVPAMAHDGAAPDDADDGDLAIPDDIGG